jgi:hypothetical protein
MAVSFYNTGDNAIYDSGQHFVPQEKYRLGYTAPTASEPIATVPGGIINTDAFNNSGGKESGQGGGGKFGNQDMSDMKEFNMPGFDKPVRGYRNTSTGMYQDSDGLNIQNLGINSFGMAGILEKAFGLKDDDDDPKYPGYFTKNKIGALLKNPGLFKQYYARQDKEKQDALQKDLDRKNSIEAIQGRVDKEYRDSGGGGFKNDPTGSKEKGFNMHGDGKMADGGRAGYFFGGRVNYKVGGRTDAESQYGADSAGSYDSSQNQSGREQSYGGNNNTPTINKFADSNVIESPFGKLGNTDTKIGYRGGVDLAKLGLTMGVDGTLSNRNFLTNDDIENKGTFYTGTNNDIFNTATNYDNSGIKDSILNSNNPYGNFGLTVDNNGKVVQGDYSNNFKGVDVGATTNFDDLNNISLSKFSGDRTGNGFSYGIGANIDPLDLSNSNAYLQARYAYGQKKKNGGRIGFKNGGLASIL